MMLYRSLRIRLCAISSVEGDLATSSFLIFPYLLALFKCERMLVATGLAEHLQCIYLDSLPLTVA
jgi:hypothetical protein